MIKIEAEKIVVRGEKRVKIFKIEALGEDDLPKKYLELAGAISARLMRKGSRLTTSINIVDGPGYSWPLLAEEETMTPEEFSDAIEKIYKAGNLLQEINAELALGNEGWSGKVEYHI